MQLITKLHLALALSAAMFTTSAIAAGPSPQDFPRRIQTVKEAEALPAETKLAFACTTCKTLKEEDKKGFMAWFAPDTKHDCPGCGGKVTYKEHGGGSKGGAAHSEYTHTCSKCGDKSAYTCASHKS